MTEEERKKWLASPPSRAEIADLMVQLGIITSSLATICGEILSNDKADATAAMRELITESREYGRLLKELIGRPEGE